MDSKRILDTVRITLFLTYLLWSGNECYRLTHPVSKITGFATVIISTHIHACLTALCPGQQADANI